MTPPSLLDSVRAGYDPAVLQKASAFLGDSESVVRRNLDAIIPVTLAAIVHKAETTTAESVAALARDAFQQDRYLHPADHFTAGGGGVPAGAPDLLTGIFGERFGAVGNAVASFTEARSASISALFGSVAPYALAVIGRHMRENNLSPAALSSWLAGQKSSIWAAVPSGLKLAGLLGAPARPSPSYVAAGAVPPERGMPWLAPVLLLLVAGAVAWWLLRSRGSDQVVSAGLDTAPRPAAAPVTPPADSLHEAAIQVTLPNGVVLDAWRGGIEDRLVAFLQDSTAKPSDDLWFDFNDLNFETGTARIIPESRRQLSNIVEVLKAFPAARIKIGGYTDSTGNEAANLKLSEDRAEAVARALRDAGVGGQVTDAEGYGSKFAKTPASASEEERRGDRRVAVSVRAK